MKTLGDDYESRAADWLEEQQGLTLLARNFRAKTGEIDIVARDGAYLAFIEVRRRSNTRYCGAAASVDRRKQQRLLRTAQLYLQRRPELANLPCRFDVIAFEPRQSVGEPEIRWIRAAFTA
jgi:putative endonuclease